MSKFTSGAVSYDIDADVSQSFLQTDQFGTLKIVLNGFAAGSSSRIDFT